MILHNLTFTKYENIDTRKTRKKIREKDGDGDDVPYFEDPICSLTFFSHLGMFCSKIYMFESKRDYNRRNRKERRKRLHNRRGVLGVHFKVFVAVSRR